MKGRAKGFFLTLAASAAATAAAGIFTLLVLLPRGPGAGPALLPLTGLALLPVAAAAAFAGVRARSLAEILLNSLAFLLPLAAGLFGGFFIWVHPGGPGGEGLVLASGAFWLQLGALYVLCVAVVGTGFLVVRRLLAPRA